MSAFLLRVVVWLPTAIVIAVAMDFWSALLHGRAWHRWLWAVHRSHHSAREGRFEANDALSALHAPLAIALILFGCAGPPGVGRELAFGVGVGMTAFGLAYVVVHDGLVHRRLPVRALLRVPYLSDYLREVARAHRVHHAGVRGGPPYGFFFGRRELARHRVLTSRAHSTPTARPPTPSVPPPTDRARA